MDDDELPGLLELQSKVAKQTWPHSIDASAWADEFRSRFPAVPRDEAIGWFANAIMAGYDTAQMRDTAEVERLREAMGKCLLGPKRGDCYASEAVELRAEVTRLRAWGEALMEHTQHTIDCDKMTCIPPHNICTCGLDAALALSPEGKP